MGRRKAFVHIGLPRTGGAFLDSALAEHEDDLEAAGLRHPAISAEEMFRAAIELRRDHRAWGYERREVEGAWAEICRRAQKGRHDVVFSQELLAACTPQQIALLLDTLRGFEVHVVVTARDPATQMVAAWAGSVEAGRSVSFARFRQRVLDPAREHDQAQRFWAGQDLGAVLARWSAAIGSPQRVHVVTVPPGALDPRQEIWAALGAITGIDLARLPLALGASPGPDPATIAVLRQVNRAVDGRLPTRAHRTVVRRYLSEGSVTEVAAPAIPADLYAELRALGERWGTELTDGGYDVRGDAADLLPTRPATDALLPDDVPAEERLSTATDALANVLVEVARLREHNQALEQRNTTLEKKRKKLKRKLAQAG